MYHKLHRRHRPWELKFAWFVVIVSLVGIALLVAVG